MTSDRLSALGVARLRTVAFSGIDVKDVDVQVQISAGLPSFTVVGLPDKAVAELRERVRSALGAMGSACRPSGSRSTSRPPTSPRRAATSICRSRSACWSASAPCPRMRSRAIWRSASWRWTA